MGMKTLLPLNNKGRVYFTVDKSGQRCFLCFSAILLLVVIQAMTCLAEERIETRTGVFEFYKDKGYKKLANGKNFHLYHKINTKLEFSVNGGPVIGTIQNNYGKDIGMAGCHEIKRKGTIEGRFEGGDGGVVKGKIKWRWHSFGKNRFREEEFTGQLFAKGEGYLEYGTKKKKRYPLTYPPFSLCDANLDPYTELARSMILEKVFKVAATEVYESFKTVLNAGWMKVVDKIHYWEFATDNYQYRMTTLTGKVPPKNFYQKMANQFIPDKPKHIPALEKLPDIADKIGKALTILHVADAAIDGAYAEAGWVALAEAVGAYSNSLGILYAVGQAVKADWDAFAKRVYEKEYRRFYMDLYYAGGKKPSEKKGSLAQRQRLRDFMFEALQTLSSGGVGGATKWAVAGGRPAQFRKMLMDYAYYKLNMDLSYTDFETTTRKGKTVLVHKHVGAVFAALFRDFEKTYRDDLNAERMRKLAIKQAKYMKKAIKDATDKMTWAVMDDFSKVWPDKKTRDAIICQTINQVRKELESQGKGLLKSRNL